MSLHVRAALAAALTTVAVSPAVAQAAPPEVPWWVSTSSMYDPPAADVPGTPGSVVWWRTMSSSDDANLGSLSGSARPNATAKRVIFRSTSVGGTPNVESATVFTPNTAAPAGGWKVVAWNHVTTGAGDLCAPSRATENLPWSFTANPEYERLTRSDELIAGLLNRGIVVVRTDYEGIGTPGPHPYMIGTSLAKSSVNAVRATRDLVPQTSTQWAVAGHSEGGVAALSTSALASSLAPELQLKATLSAAPPVDIYDLVFGLGYSVPIATPGTAMGALLMQGARLSVPAINAGYPNGLLSAAGQAKIGDLETKCLAQTSASDSIGGLSFANFFASSAPANYGAAIETELERWNPRFIALGNEPIRVYAGSLDPLALQSRIESAVAQQQAKGRNIVAHVLPWANHVTITDNAQGGVDMANWLKSQLG